MKRPRLLVANRGEIAVRIFRACRDLGIETVAVYSDADRAAPHVAMADHAARLGAAPARESYLSVPALLAAAKKTGATLVHPGYGFLAENAGFARACGEAGLTFVGPTPEAIAAMGSKTGSRELMRKAGVPVVPGTARPAVGAAELAGVRGAGGLSHPAEGLGRRRREGDAARRRRRRSSKAPSSACRPRRRPPSETARSIAEKLVERPRHIEVQVVGDTRGDLVAVGERECSIQRRHQKVVEECPSPAVGPELRARLLEAALSAARAVGYTSCGTVEFLLASDGAFYFLEMNTRLQVEHPVTEEVWGVDLAAAMIRIALGRGRCRSRRRDLAPRGHALECRVYAEDPRRGFAPSPGRIEALRLPQGPGIRNDVGVEAGSVVPIDYDPMLGKLVVHAADRPAAVARLSRALAEYEIAGVETTLPLFRALVGRRGLSRRRDFDVQWLDRRLADGLFADEPPAAEEVWLAAVAVAAADAMAPRAVRAATPIRIWRTAARREALRG